MNKFVQTILDQKISKQEALAKVDEKEIELILGIENEEK